jgi:carbon-monoxide dehydrogenase large subunit
MWRASARRLSVSAITNALVDALKPLGVHHLDMPATPEKLWRVIQEHRTPLAAE